MMTFTELASVASDPAVPFTDQLRLAVAAYLARFKGTSREHTESDLRCYLAWCVERGLDPVFTSSLSPAALLAEGQSITAERQPCAGSL